MKFLFRVSSLVFCFLAFLPLLGCPPANKQAQKKFPRLFNVTNVLDTGKEPSFIVSEDFNLDGNQDLLVLNSGDHTISYYKGKGDGEFGPAIDFKSGADPICITVADFNGDSLPDFAELNYQDQNIHVFLNVGRTFRNTGQVLKPGKIPINLTAGDFNEDGHPDIAVSMRYHKVVFLWGKGKGFFSEPEEHPVFGQPTGLVTGDYDNDNHLDLAVALAGSGRVGVQVLWGKGEKKFDSSKLIRGGGQPLTIENVDANADGFMDLVTSSNSLHAMTILMNRKERTFETLRDFSAGEFPKFVASSDFSGDGVADLAVTNSTRDTVSVLLGYGDGTFTYPPINHFVDEYPQGLVIGDFNKDGRIDLAVSCRDKNLISIMTKNFATIPALSRRTAN